MSKGKNLSDLFDEEIANLEPKNCENVNIYESLFLPIAKIKDDFKQITWKDDVNFTVLLNVFGSFLEYDDLPKYGFRIKNYDRKSMIHYEIDGKNYVLFFVSKDDKNTWEYIRAEFYQEVHRRIYEFPYRVRDKYEGLPIPALKHKIISELESYFDDNSRSNYDGLSDDDKNKLRETVMDKNKEARFGFSSFLNLFLIFSNLEIYLSGDEEKIGDFKKLEVDLNTTFSVRSDGKIIEDMNRCMYETKNRKLEPNYANHRNKPNCGVIVWTPQVAMDLAGGNFSLHY